LNRINDKNQKKKGRNILMNRKKTIAVAIVLALILLIGGMLAYFTDTDKADNVFTLGDNIEISLSEEGWTDGNNSKALGIHPGAKVDKAPVITNDSKTTKAFVFAEVVVPCYASTGTTVDTPLYTLDDIGSGWTLINTPEVDTKAKTITYVYAYGTSSKMTELNAEASTSEVFKSVTLEPTLTKEQKETVNDEPNVVVNAYGIQIDNLSKTSPTDIFDLF